MIECKLLDFIVQNKKFEEDDSSDSDNNGAYVKRKDTNQLTIQMFGIDESGKTYSITVNDFQPFFYLGVSDKWKIGNKNQFLGHVKKVIGEYYEDSIVECKLIKRKKLYGFTDNKDFKFIYMKFKNTVAYNKVKNMFYTSVINEHGEKERKLISDGYVFEGSHIELYEANIPPLLRYFHMRNISPSGWINIQSKDVIRVARKTTTCAVEIEVNQKKIKSLPEKETQVPYKICSFDIEASSSHGDFPLAIKTYKKLATNVLDFWEEDFDTLQENGVEYQNAILAAMINAAFGYGECDAVELVYPKQKPRSKKQVAAFIEKCLSLKVNDLKPETTEHVNTVTSYFQDSDDEDGDGGNRVSSKYKKVKINAKNTIIDILNSTKYDRDDKKAMITNIMDETMPSLKGDLVTFIGSTFMKYGDENPYLNHCIALDTCSDVDGTEIESYETEKEVLLAWTKLIQREDPDIIIGYNIFGFDYDFMFKRACENGVSCTKEFLKLSRNKNEICANQDRDSKKYQIEQSKIVIASGTHDLNFVKIPGRIQIDLYNYFRREYNLTSYKLDYVAGHFIGDKVKKIDNETNPEYSIISSKNLVGLRDENFIHFEEIGHSSEYYEDGAKFKVHSVDEEGGTFCVEPQVTPDMTKTVKWCLAKDDVTPQDIFRLTNEGADERAIVAKYCIQDCNLVHYLINKIDVITGFVEMAKICSVPLDFLVMRGQGIKLFSFIAKKCREANTLIPVLEKKDDGGYEGAIVLPPKSGLYLDEPVACVDYSSLYPSSMISENLSHDSKVWTKEYNLEGELINTTGVTNNDGKFIYDNLTNYKYVDVEYDTYEYLRSCRDCDFKCKSNWELIRHMKQEHNKVTKTVPSAKKTKVGKKICRFAQFPDEQLAIMPRILKELLAARKATRSSAKWKTIKTSIGDYTGLIIDKTDTHITLKDKHGDIKIIEQVSVQSMEDTYNDFMKNVLDKRQLAIKVTANSLYGQCGARTSSFYEKDVAASTTATGRKLLTYGKRIIEEVYGDRICETKYGTVHSHAEYVYGDSVTGDTPILLKHKATNHIVMKQIDDLSNTWNPYEEFKPYDTYESNRKHKQQAKVSDYEVWTKNGWANINRVIRHKCNKKIYRVVTHNSVVDVTEDHSLLDVNANKLKASECTVGTALLENNMYKSIDDNTMSFQTVNLYIAKNMSHEEQLAFIYGFFMGDGSCGIYDTEHGVKYSWALNNSNLAWCNQLKTILETVYDKDFKILDTIKSSGVYKVVPACGTIKSFVEEYNCMYDNKCKIVPETILNGNVICRQAFMAGYYLADGNKCINEKAKVLRFDCKHKLSASSLQSLVLSLGYNVSLNERVDKDVYRITCTQNSLRKPTNHIKKLYVKHETYDEFVYDIETSDGTFNTGFPLIIKNTDSVFMSFKLTDPETGEKIVGKEALKHTIELAKDAGELATKFLKAPHDLEYEKTFMPFCLLSKKRYVGMLYEEDPDKCYRKSMGIVLKRRDNAPIVKDVYGGIIDILMKEQNIQSAITFAKTCMKNIVDEKYPLEKLIITKSLRDHYKNPKQIAHKTLADRMGRRDPGNKPKSGDRIPFVYIQTKGKVQLQGDKVEHPNYIRKHNIRPDYGFYITNQIMKPVQQVFALVLEDIPSFENKKKRFIERITRMKKRYIDDEKYNEQVQKIRNREVKQLIFDEFIARCDNVKNNQSSIFKYFG